MNNCAYRTGYLTFLPLSLRLNFVYMFLHFCTREIFIRAVHPSALLFDIPSPSKVFFTSRLEIELIRAEGRKEPNYVDYDPFSSHQKLVQNRSTKIHPEPYLGCHERAVVTFLVMDNSNYNLRTNESTLSLSFVPIDRVLVNRESIPPSKIITPKLRQGEREVEINTTCVIDSD